MSSEVVANLPSTRLERGTGSVSSGSMVPRSRSPAVASTATCMPPNKVAKMRK